jgi:hypothetical protein
MKKSTTILILFIILLLITSCSKAASPDYGPVDVYAVLAEKDDYSDVGMSDLLVDYIDIQRVREALEGLGWPSENIRDLKEFDRESLQIELDWLEDNADENDLVFFFVTGHGTYLRVNVSWNDFFPEEWEQIKSQNRVLLVDSCTAAEFTNTINQDGSAGLSIAAVDEDEYGWKGIEEEGLPILGGIFNYYFAEALTDLAADGNGDGKISVQEAALAAEEKQREYMHEVVFGVPEFVEMYHGIGVEPEKDPTFPDVIMDGSVGEAVFLEVSSE